MIGAFDWSGAMADATYAEVKSVGLRQQREAREGSVPEGHQLWQTVDCVRAEVYWFQTQYPAEHVQQVEAEVHCAQLLLQAMQEKEVGSR